MASICTGTLPTLAKNSRSVLTDIPYFLANPYGRKNVKQKISNLCRVGGGGMCRYKLKDQPASFLLHFQLQNFHMKFRLFIFLLSATAADECCSAGSTVHHPVKTTHPLASGGLFVPAASPVKLLSQDETLKICERDYARQCQCQTQHADFTDKARWKLPRPRILPLSEIGILSGSTCWVYSVFICKQKKI
jgi:hypothetical protein